MCDLGQDLPLRGLSFLACKVTSGLGPPRRPQCPRRGAGRRIRARVRGISPRPPAPLPRAGTRLTGWGPRSGCGRAALRDPLPHTLQSEGLGGAGQLSRSPAPPRPRSPRPRPRFRARSPPQPPRALSHLPAPRTSERPAGPWGRPQAGSRSRGAPGEPSWPRSDGPALPASRPWAAAAPPCVRRNPRYAQRGTRGRRATGGRRTARDRARDAEDTGRVRGAPWGPGLERSAGGDGPPSGGGGRAMKTSRDERTRCAAGSRPALVTLSSASLGLGRSEVWSLRCWVPGWRRPAAQAHCPLLPPRPGGRGRPGPRAAAAAGGAPPQEADSRARAGPMRQPPCARGRRGGRGAGPLGRWRRLVPPLPHEARRAQATGVEAGRRARDTPPGK